MRGVRLSGRPNGSNVERRTEICHPTRIYSQTTRLTWTNSILTWVGAFSRRLRDPTQS